MKFQSTLPARGATVPRNRRCDERLISIHAPRTGSDATNSVFFELSNISIHAPRTGSDAMGNRNGQSADISIHAPRTGSDAEKHETKQKTAEISIHAPRTGSDRHV